MGRVGAPHQCSLGAAPCCYLLLYADGRSSEYRAMDDFAAAEASSPEVRRVAIQIPVGLSVAEARKVGYCVVSKIEAGGNAEASDT